VAVNFIDTDAGTVFHKVTVDQGCFIENTDNCAEPPVFTAGDVTNYNIEVITVGDCGGDQTIKSVKLCLDGECRCEKMYVTVLGCFCCRTTVYVAAL